MFADVDEMVVTFLDSIVTPDVATLWPNPLTGRFVRVVRSGGAAANRVLDRATVTVTCSGASKSDTVGSATLAGECRDALMNRYLEMPLVRGVEEMTAPYYDPDPDTGFSRHTFTHRLSVRAHF
mgnify:CR=1 FL=1